MRRRIVAGNWKMHETAADLPAAAHAHIRACLPDPETAVRYGGSVGPGDAAAIFAVPDVGGGLAGGASPDLAGFLPVIVALEASR